MDDNLIDKVYAEAVSGIREEWLCSTGSEWYEYLKGLPSVQQVVYMVVVLHNQVVNGGFHQYFSNAYGQFADMTVNCLHAIGANEKASLLAEALDAVNYENLEMPQFREALLNFRLRKLFDGDDLFDPLDRLDDRYCDTDEDVFELLLMYLHRHA